MTGRQADRQRKKASWNRVRLVHARETGPWQPWRTNSRVLFLQPVVTSVETEEDARLLKISERNQENGNFICKCARANLELQKVYQVIEFEELAQDLC